MGALRPLAVVVALATPLGLAACSHDSTGLASGQAASLHARVAAVRLAAQGGDPDAARSALDGFRRQVQHLVDTGVLDPKQAMALLRDADSVATDVDRDVVPSPSPTPTPTPKPPKATPAPKSEDLPAAWAELRKRIQDQMKEPHGHGWGRG